MLTVRDVIEFLEGIDDIRVEWLGDSEQLNQPVNRVNTDQDAGEGDLAWISSKQADRRPDAISHFQGSVLIGPEKTQVISIPFAACNLPKLAFILVVNRFFSGAYELSWPAKDQQIHKDAIVHHNAVLAPGVIIGSGVAIEEDVYVGPNTVIANAVIRCHAKIGANCSIGLPGFGYEKDETGRYWRFPHMGGVIIEENVEIGSNTCIDRGSIGNTVIGSGVKIDNLVHIAHNVVIGENTLVIANSMIGGSTTLEKGVWVAPSVSIMNQIRIGQGATLGMGAVVLKNVDDHAVVVGNPAKPLHRDTGNE
jgi:UDP-3-O-[3-hydroxymyristoyl] glucosamine N-acyltransferase